MTRLGYIEQIRRFIYGGFPSDDATITVNLVNQWLDQAIGIAVKQNLKDNIQFDGIDFINNSFYLTYKELSFTEENFDLWKVQLPHIPLGIGADKGISTLQIKYDNALISQTVVWLTQNQKSFFENMRSIPNKILAYYEGSVVYVKTTLLLAYYTANVTMVSGGNSLDLDSTLNVPADYIPIISEYLKQQLMFERSVPVDNINDGNDAIKTI